MRTLPLFLVTLALAVPAPAQEEEGEAFHDKKSGLIVQMPDKWSRETGREKGTIKFSAIYDLNKSRYVLFTVETGPAAGYDEATWLAREKETVTKYLKSVDTPWTTEPVMVGGERAVRYTIGGKASGDKAYDVRFRGCAVVRGDVFFRISEQSFNRAHDETADALRAIWEAVKFEEANPFAEEEKKEGGGEEEGGNQGSGGGPAKEGEAEAPKGEPTVVEDKAGNFKVSLPAGWTLTRAPQEDDGAGLRMVATRDGGSAGELGAFQVFRIRVLRADVFEQMEPGDAVGKIANEELKLFEGFFEEGSAKVMRPEIDARAQLGKLDKSCGYEMKGLPLSEETKIEEAKKLIARGDTSVTVPDYKPIVVRGRLAMISPYIYVTLTYSQRALADDERMIAELNQIHDSWEFGSTEGTPPALESDTGPFGNTMADPANAAERKKSKVHEYKKGAKVAAALKFDYVLPPGFQDAERVRGPNGGVYAVGDEVALQVVAQDGNNGWVWIKVLAVSSKTLAANTSFPEKKKVFEEWVGGFESQARGTGKLPKKPESVKVGTLDGDGCELSGKINNFTATEVNLVTDESGWRIQFELKTRGTGSKTFADGIKTFRKKFKVAKK